jgi:hypothetical protein
MEGTVNPGFPVLASIVLLASGCALNGQANAPAEPAASPPTASAAGCPPPAPPPQASCRHAGRTRAEVHAEAVEAAKHHKSTMQEDLEYFLP